MSSLQFTEKVLLEKILGMRTGYVSDFSDRTFKEFVAERTSIDIYTEKYAENGTSKANRLRTFWSKESDEVVTPLVEGLLSYAYIEKTNLDKELHVNEERQFVEARKIVQRMKDSIVGGPPQVSITSVSVPVVATDKSFRNMTSHSVQRDSVSLVHKKSPIDWQKWGTILAGLGILVSIILAIVF